MCELRECPFCGLPLTIEEGQIGGYVLQHQARSEECPLATNIDGACAPVQLIYSNKKVLETVLNTRPLEDALRAENAKLREIQDGNSNFIVALAHEIDKSTADLATLRELLGEVAKYEEIIHRWLSKGNLEPMLYEDFQVLMSRVQQKLEEK